MACKFKGHVGFRQKLILATLTGKSVRIDDIRSQDDNPGLRVSFLRLLENVTNGSSVEINYTGTTCLYRPGVIHGGKVQHDCPTSRSIGYFLEPMLALAAWGKYPLELTLRGITNDNVDITVDAIRTVLLPNLKRFGVGEEKDVELKIVKRGAPPLGGGEVVFSCPNVRQLKPIRLLDEGRIKRIRGLTYAARLSPQMANRAADTARGKLTRFIPDVYVYTDVYKGQDSGKSPGYGLTLVAESTTGALLSAECCHDPPKHQAEPVSLGKRKRDIGIGKELLADLGADVDESPQTVEKSALHFATPEDLAEHAVKLLLAEIEQGGCVDSISQWLVVLNMMLCPEDVSKVRVGKLTDFTIAYLRDLKTFFGTQFKIEPDSKSKTVVLTCLGTGYLNTFKKAS